jgi:hypothetical protein
VGERCVGGPRDPRRGFKEKPGTGLAFAAVPVLLVRSPNLPPLMSTPSPAVDAGSLVTFLIQVNGSPVDSTLEILSVVTESKVGANPVAVVRIRENGLEGFPVSESTVFLPGAALSVAAGYDGIESSIFSGAIITQRLVVDSSHDCVLEVECQTATVVQAATPPATPVLLVTYGQDLYEMNLGFPKPGEVSGTVTFPGSSLVVPNTLLELSGINARFDGLHVITAVRHTLQDGTWLTQTSLGNS